jgi:putative transposase
MSSCPWCSSSRLTRDGRDERGRVVYACAGCGRHATTESASLVSGHCFPRDIILLAVRYYLQLGAAAERIAGVLADRGLDVSGRTILRWVQKFGPALAQAVRQHRARPVTTWLVDETYVKILGKWHYLYRGVDLDGQVLDCWLAPTRDLPAAEGVLSTNHRFCRLCSRACRHRQSDVLPERDPHLGARRQAHGDRLLQPGNLDQSLRTEPRLSEIAPESHARSQECRLRQAVAASPRRDAIDRAWLRRCIMYPDAAHRRTELCACAHLCRHRQLTRPKHVEPGHEMTE